MNRTRPARPSRRAGLRSRLSAERGLTIVEVMVAAMILVLGAIAIFKIVDAATRTSYRAEQSQVVSNLLQRELERVKARDPSQVAVAPDAICELDLPSELAGTFEELPWIADSDVVDPVIPCEPVTVAEGEGDDASDVTVDIYRMITWYDPDKENCKPPRPDVEPDEACGMRRITIGAKPQTTGPGGERTYKEIQTDIVDVPGEG